MRHVITSLSCECHLRVRLHDRDFIYIMSLVSDFLDTVEIYYPTDEELIESIQTIIWYCIMKWWIKEWQQISDEEMLQVMDKFLKDIKNKF